MRMLTLSIALTLLAGSVVLSPATANAQQDEKQDEFIRNWYETCYKTKDKEKCCQLSKELLEKYPSNSYAKNARKEVSGCEEGKAQEKFQTALKAYYTPPQDANKLETLFSAGEEVLKLQPGHGYFIGWMAMAGYTGVLSQTYKNLEKVRGHAVTALKTFEPAIPPEGWKKEEWEPLREIVLAQMNQYMGYYLIETKGDQQQALDYLTKATQIKGKDGAGWKDPNNYVMRSSIYSTQYAALSAEYEKLTDEQKNGDVGKEVRKKVNDLLDTKLIPEYARVLATATKPETKALYNNAKQDFDNFWKFRTDAPDKAADYIKNFVNDPTIAAPPIPVKPETADNQNAPAAPVAGQSKMNLSTGAGVAPSGAKGSTGNSKNGKASPTKSKTPPKRKRKG